MDVISLLSMYVRIVCVYLIDRNILLLKVHERLDHDFCVLGNPQIISLVKHAYIRVSKEAISD